MNDLEIKKHSFELAKKRLKEFSEKTDAEFQIDSVRTDGGFLGLGKHRVTGDDLNPRLKAIQNHFIAVNTTNNKLIKEFKEVYNALDVLDKDYITGIVANVASIKKTSDDVRIHQDILKQHDKDLFVQQSKLDTQQGKIKKHVEEISRIVDALKIFKDKLKSYNHLTHIDKIWNDCQNLHDEICSLSTRVSEAVSTGKDSAETIGMIKQALECTDSKVSKLIYILSKQRCRIKSIVSFMDELDKITHLKNVDEMWDSLEHEHSLVENLRSELNATKKDVKNAQEDIKKSLDFVENASKYEHLKDVDTMWSKVAKNENELADLNEKSDETKGAVEKNKNDIEKLDGYRKKLSAITHLENVDELWEKAGKYSSQIKQLQDQAKETENRFKQSKMSVDQTLAAEKEKTNAVLQQFKKKIQYACWIAGGSMALALVELIIILLR